MPTLSGAVRRRLIGGSAWVLALKGISTIAAVGVGALLARVLSPNEFGAYVLATSMVIVSSVAAELGLRQAAVPLIARPMILGNTSGARGAIGAVIRLGIIGAVTAGAILAAGVGAWIAQHVFASPLLASVSWLIAAWVVSMTIQHVLSGVFRGLHDIRLATVFEGLASGSLTAILLLLMWVTIGHATLAMVLAISVSASVASLSLASLLLWRRVRSLEAGTRLEFRSVLAISWPIGVTGLAIFAVTTWTDVWIIGAFLGQRDVALYGAAVRLAALVASPALILHSVVPPLIAEMHAQGDRTQLERALRIATAWLALPSIAAFVLFAVFGSAILSTVYGPTYGQASDVMVVLSLGYLAIMLSGPCGDALAMTGNQKVMMVITIITGVLSCAAGLALVRPFGVLGVAAATTGGIFLQVGLLLLSVKRRLGIWTFARFSPREMVALFRPAT